MKKNNWPNYSQELKRVLAWPSSHYSNYPWSFFFFMGNLVAHDVLSILCYFWFIYTLSFFLYKSKRYMCSCSIGKCSSFRRRVKPSLAWCSWDGIRFISILQYFCNKYFIYFLTFFYYIYFHLVNISYPVTCLKLFNTLCHQKSRKMDLVWIM